MVNTILYFSEGGDSFETARFPDWERLLPNDPGMNPFFAQGSAICRTHEQVLAFLQNLEADPHLANQAIIWHRNHHRFPDHCYEKHCCGKSPLSHQDSLNKMIEYVKLRIREKQTPHVFFDRIAKDSAPILKRLYQNLDTPVICIFPAAAMVGIGIVQIIAGLAASILFIPFSLVSNNAEIIAKRSWNHVPSGMAGIIYGIFRISIFIFPM